MTLGRPKTLDTRLIRKPDIHNVASASSACASGDMEENAEEFNPNYHISGKDLNVISDFDLHKGKNYIDIRFEDNDIHSLIIKAYEN